MLVVDGKQKYYLEWPISLVLMLNRDIFSSLHSCCHTLDLLIIYVTANLVRSMPPDIAQ